MLLSLQNISPVYLEAEKITGSDIWQNTVVFSKGEKVQVVAPSGKGKTSLVHFIYGLKKDFEGEILVKGESIKSMGTEALARMRREEISIIFQDLRLFQDHTALENIEVKKALYPHLENRISYMAEKLGIGAKLNQLCRHCSYGEQQRIAIIRALQPPFSLLIMDEPFSNLDELNRHKAMSLIEEVANERKAAIILFDLKNIEFFNADTTLYL